MMNTSYSPIENICTSLEIIHTRSEILIPDPKSSGSANNSKNFIYMRLLCCQITFINLFVTDPAMEWIQVTDRFHKLKVMDLNISGRVNNSPFLINNEIIEKYSGIQVTAGNQLCGSSRYIFRYPGDSW